MGAASRVQPVLDKVTSLRLQPSVIHLLQPTVLLNRQLSPSHMDGEADLYCLCEGEKKKDAALLPPPSLNAPPIPTSLVQHKGMQGNGHSLDKGAVNNCCHGQTGPS